MATFLLMLLSSLLLLGVATEAFSWPATCQRARPRMRILASSSSSVTLVTELMRQEAEQEMAQLIEYCQQQAAHAQQAPLLWSTPAQAVDYLNQHNINAVLFDCHGVLYRSPFPIPHAAECLQALIKSGRRVYFVTNSSSLNPAQLRHKLTQILSLPSDLLTQDQCISTCWTVAHYLQSLPDAAASGRRAYVIGSAGLRQEITRVGWHIVNNNDDDNDEPSGMSRDELAAYDFDAIGPIDAVVVGLDPAFNFRKLCLANVLLQRNPHAPLVATNTDKFGVAGADGRYYPGNGSLVQAVAFSSGREAVDCGKPSAFLAKLLQDELDLDPRRTIFVGDRLDTDIKFAMDCGMHAALVLTGVTKVAQLQTLMQENTKQEQILPTVIMPHVGYLAG